MEKFRLNLLEQRHESWPDDAALLSQGRHIRQIPLVAPLQLGQSLTVEIIVRLDRWK
jgi:hypothetical protein